MACPILYGNTIHPSANGHGWKEAALSAPHGCSQAYTGTWGFPLRETFPGAGGKVQPGRTRAVTYGCSAGRVSTPKAIRDFSTSFGGSIPPLMNGHGWAATAR